MEYRAGQIHSGEELDNIKPSTTGMHVKFSHARENIFRRGSTERSWS